MRLKVFIHLLSYYFVITAMGYHLCCEQDHIIFFFSIFSKNIYTTNYSFSDKNVIIDHMTIMKYKNKV